MIRIPNPTLLNFFRTDKAITYLVIGLLLVNCSVRLPVSSVSARDERTNGLIEWPEITDENDDHRIVVRPLENVDQMLLFEVEVTNKNQDSLYINPQHWQLQYFSNKYDRSRHSVDTLSYPLTGSEINDAYQDIAKRIQKARDGTIALLVIGIVVVVVVVLLAASAGSKRKEKRDSRDSNAAHQSNNSGLNVSVGLGYVGYAQPKTDHWTTKEKITYFRLRGEVLKEINNGPRVLLKGESHIFGLFFPRKELARDLILNGAIDNQSYSWDFVHDGQTLPNVKL